MQDDIIRIIEKNKNNLPEWIAQFEIFDLIKKTMENNIPNKVAISENLKSMRKYNEFPFKELNASDKRNPRCFLIILKEVKREDLLMFKNKFRRGSYIYKIK